MFSRLTSYFVRQKGCFGDVCRVPATSYPWGATYVAHDATKVYTSLWHDVVRQMDRQWARCGRLEAPTRRVGRLFESMVNVEISNAAFTYVMRLIFYYGALFLEVEKATACCVSNVSSHWLSE